MDRTGCNRKNLHFFSIKNVAFFFNQNGWEASGYFLSEM